MKIKTALFICVAFIFFSLNSSAQRNKKDCIGIQSSHLQIPKVPTDTLMPGSFATGTPTLYQYVEGGYSFGVNALADRAMAQVYKVSTSYIVNGVALWIGAKQQIGTADTLNVFIYKLNGPGTDTSGIINTAPDSVNRQLRITIDNIDTTGLTFLSFPSEFIEYVDYAVGINFSSMDDDTLGLVSTQDGEAVVANLSWNQWSDGTWHSVYDSLNWGMNLDLGIFMIVDQSSANVNDNYFVDGIKLSQNQPNPASGCTLIQYEIETAGQVTLEMYDLAGKKVLTINDGKQLAGRHSLIVPTENLQSGNYYYSLKSDHHRLTKKMTIIQQ
jgi:hypothetical protein